MWGTVPGLISMGSTTVPGTTGSTVLGPTGAILPVLPVRYVAITPVERVLQYCTTVRTIQLKKMLRFSMYGLPYHTMPHYYVYYGTVLPRLSRQALAVVHLVVQLCRTYYALGMVSYLWGVLRTVPGTGSTWSTGTILPVLQYVLPLERVLRYSTVDTAVMYVVRSMRCGVHRTSTTRTGLRPMLRSNGESYRRAAVLLRYTPGQLPNCYVGTGTEKIA
jgi:hypothetical protein